MQPSLLRLIPALTLTALVNLTCTKTPLQPSPTDRNLITEAQRYFSDSVANAGHAVNYRASLRRDLRWDQAQVIQLTHGAAVVIPIVYADPILIKANYTGPSLFHIDYLTTLWIYRDGSGRLDARCITSFPDSNFFKDPTHQFTGLKFVEDWQGHPIEKLLYLPGGPVKKYVSDTRRPDALDVIQTCYAVDGYNYAEETGEVYTWSENAGCSTSYVGTPDLASLADAAGEGSGSSGSGSSGATAVTVLPGNSVIKNIKTYFQCYTNVGGNDHTYTITVCVDQPDPGTREPWASSINGVSSGSNIVNVGHTFLMLTESYSGTTITRNVGFYPLGNVNPTGTTSQGTLNDDETHQYNISGSFNVTNAQFFTILNYVSQGNSPGYLYDLNTNNCTTFVINAVAQAGIDLPRTVGTWLGGAGNDPGDLGEDLRTGNIPGMTLNLSGGTISSHYNVGQCN